MSDSTLFLILSLGLLAFFRTDWATAEDVKIANCLDGYIDIQVNANKTVLCEGLDPKTEAIWTIEKDDTRIPVARCNASACFDPTGSGGFSAQRSRSQSELFFHQYGCGNDSIRSVICTSQLSPGFERTGTCKINAINPAVLSDCFVQKDDVNGGVKGSCQFQHAISCNRGFVCTWHQADKENVTRRTFAGVISTRAKGVTGTDGSCHFSRSDLKWDPAAYSYSVTFYPGPTLHNVPVTTSGEQFLSTGEIVGIAVAVVVVIAVIAVIVVAVWWLKKRQKPAANVQPSRVEAETAKDGLYFEEHINPMYETSEDQDAIPRTNPYTKTNNLLSAKPLSSALATEGGDGYEIVSPRSHQNQNVSSGHSASVATNSYAASHVYARPDTSAKQGKRHEAKDAAAYAQPQKPKTNVKVKDGGKGSPRKEKGVRITGNTTR